MGWVILLLLSSYLFFFNPPQINACSCADSTPKQAYENHDFVYRGKIISVERRKSETRYLFNVQETWKGVEYNQVIVETEWTSCMVPFQNGKEYLVYGKKTGQYTLVTDICSRTAETSIVQEDLNFLGKGKSTLDQVDLIKTGILYPFWEKPFRTVFPIPEELKSEFGYWEYFSRQYTPYRYHLSIPYFLIMIVGPLISVIEGAYKLAGIQSIYNLIYTGWLFMTSWDFTLDSAYTNLWFSFILFGSYLVTLLVFIRANFFKKV